MYEGLSVEISVLGVRNNESDEIVLAPILIVWDGEEDGHDSLTDTLEISILGLAQDGFKELEHLGKECIDFLGHHGAGGDATAMESGGGGSDSVRAVAATWPVERGHVAV